MPKKNKRTAQFLILIAVIAFSSLFLSACKDKDSSQIEDSNKCVAEGERGSLFPGAPACCTGLSGISCDEVGSDGACTTDCSDEFICAYCGNSVCGKGENKCNCPRDCN